jgi:ketosteroid isomerase-like protein
MTDGGSDPVSLILEFVGRLNAHDVKGMCDLMTEDHLFVDSLGEQLRGREQMRRAWVQYFYLFPDFTITCQNIFRRDHELALFGSAQGSYTVGSPVPASNRWQMPAAWRAVVRGGRVAEWHVFADNEPVRRLMTQQGDG